MMTEHLALVRDYDGLVAALRVRKAELGLSDDTLETIAGLTKGHVSKILPTSRVKHMGPLTLRLVLQALGVQLAVVDDPEQMARIRTRIEQRDEKRVRGARSSASARQHRKSTLINQRNAREMAALRILKYSPEEWSKRARTSARKRLRKQSKADRRRIARKAASDRWHRPPHRPVNRCP